MQSGVEYLKKLLYLFTIPTKPEGHASREIVLYAKQHDTVPRPSKIGN